MNKFRNLISNSKIFLLISLLTISFGFTSCNSTKQESKESTTFVVTKPTPENKIYTTIAFKKIESVEVRHLKTSSKIMLSSSNFKYNKTTSELSVRLPKNAKFSLEDAVFKVTGIPYFPAEFILCNATYNLSLPGVFINGRKAIKDKDYTFDKNLNRIKFITPLDSDKDSYNILWYTKQGYNSMNNAYEKYSSEYKKLEKEFLNVY